MARKPKDTEVGVVNTTEYVDREPTNLRLDPKCKEILKEEAERLNVTMSDIVNELIKSRYGI